MTKVMGWGQAASVGVEGEDRSLRGQMCSYVHFFGRISEKLSQNGHGVSE
jgi:hypothetical protein